MSWTCDNLNAVWGLAAASIQRKMDGDWSALYCILFGMFVTSPIQPFKCIIAIWFAAPNFQGKVAVYIIQDIMHICICINVYYIHSNMCYSYRHVPSGVVSPCVPPFLTRVESHRSGRRTAMNDIGDGHNVEIPRVFGPVHLDFEWSQWVWIGPRWFSCVFCSSMLINVDHWKTIHNLIIHCPFCLSIFIQLCYLEWSCQLAWRWVETWDWAWTESAQAPLSPADAALFILELLFKKTHGKQQRGSEIKPIDLLPMRDYVTSCSRSWKIHDLNWCSLRNPLMESTGIRALSQKPWRCWQPSLVPDMPSREISATRRRGQRWLVRHWNDMNHMCMIHMHIYIYCIYIYIYMNIKIFDDLNT